MPHVVLTGFKGCGKSTIGAVLAERLDREFIDLDFVIEDLFAQKETRLRFREIFRVIGREEFRRLERRSARLVRMQAARSGAPLVIALGGGSLVDLRSRGVLRKIGTMVYLRVAFAELRARTIRSGMPAFLEGDGWEEQAETLFHEREPIYYSSADVIVDASGLAPDEIVDRIAVGLREQPHR